MIDEMSEMIVDGAWEIHDMPGVTVSDGWEDEDFFWKQAAGATRDFGWANDIDIEGQMMSMLFNGPTGYDADFSQVDSVVDFGPG